MKTKIRLNTLLLASLFLIISACSNNNEKIEKTEKTDTFDGLYLNSLEQNGNSGLDFKGSKVELVGNHAACDFRVEGKYLYLENIPYYGSAIFEIIDMNTIINKDGPFEGTYIKQGH